MASLLSSSHVQNQQRLRVLFLAASPHGHALQLDQEAREITAKLRAAEHRDSLELVTRWAVRPDDLQQALLEVRPHVLHFSGHGANEAILLLNDQGQAKPVSQEALQHLLFVLKDQIRLVVLNACYSRQQAEAITQRIDCAVGMNQAIGDRAAIYFAGSFYRALAFGRSVKEAFELGRSALLLEGIEEDQTPELLARKGLDPSGVFLVRPPPDPSGHDLEGTTVRGDASISVSGNVTTNASDCSIAIGVANAPITLVKSLSELDEMSPEVKARLHSLYEEQVRLAPEHGRTNMALGLYYLDLRLYDRARYCFLKAHEADPLQPDTLYYLALSMMGGRAPSRLRLARIREVESYLQAAISLGTPKAHMLYLMAMIACDFYEAKSLQSPLPSVEALVQQAQSVAVCKRELVHLVNHAPAPESPITKAILARMSE